MTQPWWRDACQPLDSAAMEQARARQQQLTKPAGSLGQLEGLAVQLAGLQGCERPTRNGWPSRSSQVTTGWWRRASPRIHKR